MVNNEDDTNPFSPPNIEPTLIQSASRPENSRLLDTDPRRNFAQAMSLLFGGGLGALIGFFFDTNIPFRGMLAGFAIGNVAALILSGIWLMNPVAMRASANTEQLCEQEATETRSED